jgi:hypothetical protein
MVEKMLTRGGGHDLSELDVRAASLARRLGDQTEWTASLPKARRIPGTASQFANYFRED